MDGNSGSSGTLSEAVNDSISEAVNASLPNSTNASLSEAANASFSEAINSSSQANYTSSPFPEEPKINIEADPDSPSFIDDVREQVFDYISKNQAGPRNIQEHIEAFTSAVDFSERWIQCVLAMHVLIFILVVTTRRIFYAQAALFFILISLIAASEPLNRCLSENWRGFAKQNYFDEHGVFMGVMWAGPLLFIGFIQLISLLLMVSNLLVKAKRLELQHKMKDDKKKKKENAKSEADKGGSGNDGTSRRRKVRVD